MVTNINREKLDKYLVRHIDDNRTLLEHNPDGIFVLDLDGYFALLNSACEKLMGYPENALLELKITDLFQDERTKMEGLLHKALKGEFRNFDSFFHHFNKQKIHVNITYIPISVNDEIVGVFGIAKDITDLKNKQLQLRRNQEIYHFLTGNSLDIITRTETNGNLSYLSPACRNILGYHPEELVGIYSGDLIHEDDVKALVASFNSLLKGEKYGTLVFRAKHKNGYYIWMEAHLSPMINPETNQVEAIMSVIRDINERMAREETYRSIIKHSPDAIFIADGNDFLFMNDQFVELLDAKNKEEIIKRGFYSFVPTQYMDSVRERIQLVKQGGIGDFNEMTIITMSGRKKQIEAKVIPTKYQNKPARHVIIRDITERIHTQKVLLNSEKLTVAGQLAAGIAHEVRNPLTSIRGFIQLLEKLGDGKSEYFSIIYREIDRINQILSELLTLAKPQDTHFQRQDLFTLLEQVKVLLGTQATMNNILIETDFPEGETITISCDENQLKQVFINFIKNSIEAMPKGGKIYIKVHLDPDHVKLTFKDQGTGIPKELLDRIGEPFFTTKENGTGLGLMISKQIIDNHNGKFAIQSSKKGTTIEVALPIENN